MKLKDFLNVYHGKFDVLSFRGNLLSSNFKNYPQQQNVEYYFDEEISEIISVKRRSYLFGFCLNNELKRG